MALFRYMFETGYPNFLKIAGQILYDLNPEMLNFRYFGIYDTSIFMNCICFNKLDSTLFISSKQVL
jgi:hypothetical protein